MPLLVALGVGLARCDRREPQPAPVDATPAPTPAPLPVPTPVLSRADLLAAIDVAASDAAAGVAPTGSDPLVGRRFAMRLAFGCFGPDPQPPGLDNLRDGVPRWTWTADERSIRLSLSTADWSGGDITGPPVEGFETVNGVWINQPWMRRETCPDAGLPTVPAAPVAAPPRVGLAMLRETGASRVGRAADRAFAHTIRGEGDQPATPSAQGYRLVLEGRVARWAGGRAIRCLAVTPTRPPPCVLAVQIDRVAFEDGTSGAVLSEWRTH